MKREIEPLIQAGVLREVDGKWYFVDANDWGRLGWYEVRICQPPGDTTGPDVHYARSEVQEIAIANTVRFGKSLWLKVIGAEDKFWPQFYEGDEHYYHIPLVIAVLFSHPQPHRVLILGGGDYLAAWRALMRRGVEYVKIADWDPMVGSMVRKHIGWIDTLGIHNHPTVDWKEGIDVRRYLTATSETFDVIIGDLSDVTAMTALVPHFLAHIVRILKPGGVFTTQAGPMTPVPEVLGPLERAAAEFREHFETVWLSASPVESFNYPQAFLTGWKDRRVEPTGWSTRKFAERFDMAAVKRDRPLLDGDAYRGLFAIPRNVRSSLNLP